jgi:hypothetical protein
MKKDSIFVVPYIVEEELGIDDRYVEKFNLQQVFYIEVNKNRNNKNQPHGTI